MASVNLQKIAPLLDRNYVSRAGVFGSYARGEASEESDVDLLVKFEKARSLLEIIRLEREISETLGKKVDLVTEPSLNRHLRKYILDDLKVFYEKRR